MKQTGRSTFRLLALLALCIPFAASAEEAAAKTIITNVMVWDGTSDERVAADVLIEGNLVKQVAPGIKAAGTTVIDGKGGTVIPGLIDMHAHFCIQEGMTVGRLDYDQMAMGARTYLSMLQYLDQGFTTARSAGCNDQGIAKAINNGLLKGPRVFPAGGFLSQTGGHADTGGFNDPIGATDDLEKHGFGYIVDGPDEVRKAARHNLRSGATHIKIMAGGGVASEFDPIHMTQFSLEEMKAAVETAADYGTYVIAHAYHDRSVNRAIDAGVRVIEHNFLVSEDTIKRMKKEGVALSAQAVMSLEAFADPESITFFSPDQKAKAARVNKGADQMFRWARKHDLLIVTGGDMFGPAYNNRQADNMVWMAKVGFTPLEILKMGTSNAAIVLGWSGEMNQYKYGKLGVVEEGAYADLVVVDGNPLENIEVLNEYKEKFKLVMKDGEIHKNML